MRSIVVVCRSKKTMRKAAAKVLDTYLFRIADRTWQGYASNACLARISKDLKAVASRHMSVAVYEQRSSHESKAPLFIVGSRSKFGEGGLCPIHVNKIPSPRVDRTPGQTLLKAAIQIAILFHDIGKETKLFQDKLSRSLETGEAIADPVRHEVYSSYFFDSLASDYTTDAKFMDVCTNAPDSLNFEKAHANASKACLDLYRMATPQGGGQIWFELDKLENAPIRRSILELILTHHRLPEHTVDFHARSASVHVRKRDEDPETLSPDSFSVRESLVQSPVWLNRLQKAALEVISTKDGVMPDIALYGRTAMMLCDHLGSARKEASEGHDVLANTTTDRYRRRVPADSLEQHVSRVYSVARPASQFSFMGGTRYLPSLSAEECPESITDHSVSDDHRFAWQGQTAQSISDMVSQEEGGFFGCLIARTGKGKTRAAPLALAAAALNDANPDRRQLRYNLALNLRTLATQSGIEYVEDLGFTEKDVATLVGGYSIDWSELEEGEGGSEDRLEAVEMLDTSNPYRDIPEDGQEHPSWIKGLGNDLENGLPPFVEKVIEHSGNAGSLKKMLETPILSATIDHFMPAADASRGGHIAQMMRVMSSDMIIDEIDLFSEEDLSAISRLAYIVGAFGRRLIIMSATLSKDIAEEIYSSYTAGWKSYSKAFNAPSRVHSIIAGDNPDSIVTSQNQADFGQAYDECAQKMVETIKSGDPLRRSYILDPVGSFDEVAKVVDDACAELHYENHILHEGFRISAGLVRLTRIQHVRQLASFMKQRPGMLRKYVYLHSNMPLAQRQHIERTLKKALTRKGADPNSELISLLEKYGVLAQARRESIKDVSLIVISSPVIETGNDVDFDFAVIDPSSVRAIVQTAGRVNRHRSIAVDHPNIAILNEYLVSTLEGGEIIMPGVETKPHSDTGVPKVTLDTSRCVIPGYSDNPVAFDVVDAHLMIDQDESLPILESESALRNRFFNMFPGTAAYRDHPKYRLSASYKKMRRFRRQDSASIDCIPFFDGDRITGWEHKDQRGRRVPITIQEVYYDELKDHMLITEDLNEILGRFSSEPGLLKQGTISVSNLRERTISISSELGFELG